MAIAYPRGVTAPEASNSELVVHYTERFVAHLDGCATWRDARDPEPFLLHARKAVEAAVYVAHLRPPSQKGVVSRSLEESIKALTSRGTDPRLVVQLQLIRTHTNAAAHVAEPNAHSKAEDVEEVARALRKVASWFFEASSAAEADARARANAALEAIEKRARPSPDLVAARTAEDLERTRAELTRASDELRAARRDTENSRPGRTRAAGVVGIGVAFMAGTLVGVAGRSLVAHSSIRGAVAASDEVAARFDGDDSEARGGADAGALEPVAAALAAPSIVSLGESRVGLSTAVACPGDMRLIDAEEIEIAQPVGGRETWPPPRPAAIEPIGVEAFCIDPHPVTQGELDDWRRGRSRFAPAGCRSEAGGEPAGCVSDAEAAEFCRDRGGSLPTIVQWERVARVPDYDGTGSGDEWVDDMFPPTVFHRHGCGLDTESCEHRMVRGLRIPSGRLPPAPHVLFSWNAPNVDDLARPSLGFRCAAVPTERTP